jgi:hypothetical protein
MKSLIRHLFLNHWQRKCISIVLAVIIWLIVNHSMTGSRTIDNISVRVINIPEDKTIDGISQNGILNKKISLTLYGSNAVLEEISSNDLEVYIDAKDKPDESIISISKKNLASLNPDIDLSKGISRVMHKSFIIRLTKLIKEKIPVIITQPIGEAPKGYQFLDVYPYTLNLTVQGPEGVLKHLKTKGVKMTFNLNDVSKEILDALAPSSSSALGSEVSYLVPSSWKNVSLPLLSEVPLEIDDPKAKELRIEFIRSDLVPITKQIPIALYFPSEHLNVLDPESYNIAVDDCVEKIKSVRLLNLPLYAKGVSSLFLEVVEDMLQIQIIVTPHGEHQFLNWSLQCVDSRTLENRYISILMSDASNSECSNLSCELREEYLRNRFRNYMQKLLLYTADNIKLQLTVTLDNQTVHIRNDSKTSRA